MVQEKVKKEKEKVEYRGKVFSRLFEYTKGMRIQFFLAIFCALIAGAVHPGAALLLANIWNEQFVVHSFSSVNIADPNVASSVSDA